VPELIGMVRCPDLTNEVQYALVNWQHTPPWLTRQCALVDWHCTLPWLVRGAMQCQAQCNLVGGLCGGSLWASVLCAETVR
jgi:hypothetical protein